MTLGVLLLLFVSGAIGAAWGARRPERGALMGFAAGAFAGFGLLFVGVVAMEVLR